VSRQTWERNTSGLAAAAQHRKQQTWQRVEVAIAQLLREHEPITFAAVAKAAKVTKQYLYANDHVRGRIEALRDRQVVTNVHRRVGHQPPKTDASKDLVILAKERRIKDLEEDVRQLKKELQSALGKLYDRL
jgi:Family of unknown function (DUF6262)